MSRGGYTGGEKWQGEGGTREKEEAKHSNVTPTAALATPRSQITCGRRVGIVISAVQATKLSRKGHVCVVQHGVTEQGLNRLVRGLEAITVMLACFFAWSTRCWFWQGGLAKTVLHERGPRAFGSGAS